MFFSLLSLSRESREEREHDGEGELDAEAKRHADAKMRFSAKIGFMAQDLHAEKTAKSASKGGECQKCQLGQARAVLFLMLYCFA